MTGTQLELFPISAIDGSTPDYLAPDTYTGLYTVGIRASTRVETWSARSLAILSGEGAIFESIGYVHGLEKFTRSRYVADQQGNLHCYNAEGAKSIVHPADRPLRILIKR